MPCSPAKDPAILCSWCRGKKLVHALLVVIQMQFISIYIIICQPQLIPTDQDMCAVPAAGSSLCNSCHPLTEVLRYISDQLNVCIAKVSACPIIQGFLGCGLGYYAAGGRTAATAGAPSSVLCSPCPRGFVTPQHGNRGPSGAPMLQSQCQRCPDYMDTFTWGGISCQGCESGAIASSKNAPIECWKCPPGTFKPTSQPKWSNSTNECFSCPQGVSKGLLGVEAIIWAVLLPSPHCLPCDFHHGSCPCSCSSLVSQRSKDF